MERIRRMEYARRKMVWEPAPHTLQCHTESLLLTDGRQGALANVSNSLAIINSYNPWRPTANVQESGLQIKELENNGLTYEKKHELNIGADIGFIDNRINVAFDWYRRNNYDLIGIVNTVGVGGQISKYANMASMRSHGVEFTLSTRNIVTKDFKWNTDFIFSKAKNKVTDLKSNSTIMEMISGSGFALEGYPVRSLFSMVSKDWTKRVYQRSSMNPVNWPQVTLTFKTVTTNPI